MHQWIDMLTSQIAEGQPNIAIIQKIIDLLTKCSDKTYQKYTEQKV